ncbi:hypothetical protein EVAR_45713_1 [Eumeta japonica]|uniref:Uncharacterized protein n=1 Tax=Eumeta variegata TaxID=151549 RepID=A0A4C1WVM9_EUMVA|nr:hypothetical protein EVAR_45713_1 [Eumeta japonica]
MTSQAKQTLHDDLVGRGLFPVGTADVNVEIARGTGIGIENRPRIEVESGVEIGNMADSVIGQHEREYILFQEKSRVTLYSFRCMFQATFKGNTDRIPSNIDCYVRINSLRSRFGKTLMDAGIMEMHYVNAHLAAP